MFICACVSIEIKENTQKYLNWLFNDSLFKHGGSVGKEHYISLTIKK